MFINKTALWKNICIDDWTTKRANITNNVNSPIPWVNKFDEVQAEGMETVSSHVSELGPREYPSEQVWICRWCMAGTRDGGNPSEQYQSGPLWSHGNPVCEQTDKQTLLKTLLPTTSLADSNNNIFFWFSFCQNDLFLNIGRTSSQKIHISRLLSCSIYIFYNT